MRTIYYLKGKRITKKALTEMIGAEEVKRLTKEAKESFFRDPLVQQSFYIGYGMLTIEFV
ncbi:MAG: hypothetical protein LUG52_09335 [Clostridia bacterium]|nr:hypothetical protein [Clostridia bacterium]